MSLAVVILAAGEGTRMKSKYHKAMQEVAGRPILEHILRAIEPLKPERTVLIVGYGEEQIRKYFKDDETVSLITQDFDKGYGTGAAFMQAAQELADFDGDILALYGDGPLLKTETLQKLSQAQASHDGMCLVTSVVKDPTGMGRIIKNTDGTIAGIVEEKDANEQQRKINEVNPSIFLFSKDIFKIGQGLDNKNASGEYYLTDMVELYIKAGKTVKAVVAEEEEVLSANDRKELFTLEKILRDRIRDKWLKAGVTMTNPEQTYIDDTVVIERDVVLEPGVIIIGNTIIKEDARIGAYSHLKDCIVKNGAQVKAFTIASNKSFS
ncbi:MAG TPA: bifunctional N-acetylglucosamine-1-phosphate uridyltransferase/glucosamine-1-phosphate acetyltransferase [Trueperaceae bacterium]|nr:bifunctional N-acetylglucosamine-1-phosphate uridyltransferase/glucosamine-1-phosphate acetyltransferase [Trueperaceae bacterium]